MLLSWGLSLTLFQVEQVRTDVSYTYFKQQVAVGNVEWVSAQADTIRGTFREAVPYPPDAGTRARSVKEFSTTVPAFADPGLETLLNEHGVIVTRTSAEEGNPLLTTALHVRPGAPARRRYVLALQAVRQRGRWRNLRHGEEPGQAVRRRAPGQNKVTFADVAGIDEAEEELIEIVDFLKDPTKYTRLGGTAPRGVLLVGAPGTGKTLLAKAVAGEAGVPFLSMGASEFVEMFVGVGASRVRDLFKQAREIAPAIVFIDELDAIGRARGRGLYTGNNSEQEQTLNQILTEMDGFGSQDTVIVLAATNRPDMLDAALLRAGRFDRRVVGPGTRQDRSRGDPPRPHARHAARSGRQLEVDRGVHAGLVGADLRNLANEAALLAARRAQEMVHERDFMDALEKIALGPARPLLMSPDERKRVAYHESGHTILGLLVPEADPVNRVTIVPHGMALGVTYQRPPDDRHNLRRALSSREGHRRDGRPSGRVAGVRQQDDRRGERHAAGDGDRPPDGDPLGHERQAWPRSVGSPRESVSQWWSHGSDVRSLAAVQRDDGNLDRRRGPTDPSRSVRRSRPAPLRAPPGAGPAGEGAP